MNVDVVCWWRFTCGACRGSRSISLDPANVDLHDRCACGGRFTWEPEVRLFYRDDWWNQPPGRGGRR